MEAHHQRVIQRIRATFEHDPRFPAIIVGGSVAKGRAAYNSDVDLLLVATDEEYAKREATQDFWYINRELCDYEGGYVEGKYINMQYLLDAADHGSEPARAAFVGAFLACSRIPGIESLLQRIPVYQEQERRAKIETFYSQVLILNWFMREAEKRNDTYLLAHTASEMVLFGGRLILAHNRILYPYHKWFLYELRHAANKPADFMNQIERLLKYPGKENAQTFCDTLTHFQNWGVTYEQAINRFYLDSEWNWRTGRPPPFRIGKVWMSGATMLSAAMAH